VPYYTLLSYEIFSRGTIPVEENTNYTLTMMLKGDQNVSLQTRIQGSWGGDVFKSNTTMAGPKWRQHKIEFNTGNRDFIILTFINNCMSTGTMYIDCVELYKEGSDENLLTNSSFEEKTNGSVNNWSTPKKPFSFVEGLPPIESTLVLKSNDTPINKLQTGNISASVVLTNDYGIETGLLIAALYQGNKLVALSVDQTTSNLPPGGQETLEATLSVTHVDENTALKIMLFDSPTKLQPCMKRVVVSQTGIKND
jgi:hypothetical protein